MTDRAATIMGNSLPQTVHGLAVFDPSCVILDFRDFRYRWGNTLLMVFDFVQRFMRGDHGGPDFPIVVVTSNKCRASILSLVTPTGKQQSEWRLDDIDVAIDYAILKANEWIDAKHNNAMHRSRFTLGAR